MPATVIGADRFETFYDRIEVTSLHRPNPGWRHVDAAGHEHRWYTGGSPAERYDPLLRYDVPTLVTVVDAEATDDYPGVSHSECRLCRARVWPGYTADFSPQYIPGLRHYRINGERVTPEEFERRARAAGLQ